MDCHEATQTSILIDLTALSRFHFKEKIMRFLEELTQLVDENVGKIIYYDKENKCFLVYSSIQLFRHEQSKDQNIKDIIITNFTVSMPIIINIINFCIICFFFNNIYICSIISGLFLFNIHKMHCIYFHLIFFGITFIFFWSSNFIFDAWYNL